MAQWVSQIMRTPIPEPLLKIADEIEARGCAQTTKLTALKKWFDCPRRLSTFALFIAKQASSRKGKTTGEAAELFHAGRSLLAGFSVLHPKISRPAAEDLHDRLKVFQNEFKKVPWGVVRTIHNWNLFLVEEGLEVYLWRADCSSEGYRLAANYCKHYDPNYGESLNGPSHAKILEIVRFMINVEATEEFQRAGSREPS